VVPDSPQERAGRKEDERKKEKKENPPGCSPPPSEPGAAYGSVPPFPGDGAEQMTACQHVSAPPARAPAGSPLRAAVAPAPNVGSFQLTNG